jgi:hypothetical protein
MASLKVFSALGEGVRLVRREPVAALVWSGVYFVTMGIPALLLFTQMGAMFSGFDAQAVDETVMMQRMMGSFAFMPLMWIGTLIGYTVIGGAILRATIHPDDRKAFYLRVSKAELWMALSAIVGAIIAYIAFIAIAIVLMIPVFIVVAAAAGMGNELLIQLAPLFLLLLLYPAGLVVILRFVMGPVMSFDEQRFRLFESWPLTKGRGWRLVGLALMLTLLMIAIEAVLVVIALIAMGPALLTGFSDPAAIERFTFGMMKFYSSPWMWLVCLVGSVIAGPMLAVFIAPWARAYLMLKDAVAAPIDTAESRA